MKLVLNSIVRNEERVITRMLDSVADIVDAVVIVDTGSTDSTREKIREWGARFSNIPVIVQESAWVNFGVNRTDALNVAKSQVQALGFNPAETWLLLLDADMQMQMREEFPRLEHGVYSMKQGSEAFQYDNVRLLRADVPASYVGSTHEYLSTEKTTAAAFTAGWILDVGDGGCKANKFTRDLELLTADLEKDPENPRTWFYLAQSYRDSGDAEKAIECYRKRATLGGFEEERWYSQYQVGCLLLRLGRNEEAVGALTKAHLERKHRIEPVITLAKYYQSIREHGMALMWADVGEQCNRGGDTLFVDVHAHTYGVDEVRAISCYYTGKISTGMESSDRLWLDPRYPSPDNYLMNSSWYLTPLPHSRQIVMHPQWVPMGWHPCNPSIVACEDGYLMTLRCVNYKIRHDGSYDIPGGIVRTRNFLVNLDKDFRPVKYLEIQMPTLNPQARIQGIEDARLFPSQQPPGINMLGTFLEETGVPTMYQFTVSGSTGEVQTWKRLSFEGAEKNWLPYADREFIHSYYPTVFTGDIKNPQGLTQRLPQGEANIRTKSFRGGAVVEIPRHLYSGYSYLAVIHEVINTPEYGKRLYLHRFVAFDAEFRISAVSTPFYLFTKDIEFVAGIAIWNDSFVLSSGWNDNKALLTITPRSVVEDMLRPLT